MTAYGMTKAETVAALVARGVPRARAEIAAERQVRRQAPTIAPDARAVVTLPLTLTLPWSCLWSDNKRYSATIRNGAPLLVLSSGYREAKDRIQSIARCATCGASPELGPVILEARVAVPDHRRHDLSNFCKVVHDSLEGIVYANDSQITDLRWWKVGVDIDAPHALITISRG